MRASNGSLILENGHPIMLYVMLDANQRIIRDQMMRPLLETKIEFTDGKPVVHGGRPLMKHPMID